MKIIFLCKTNQVIWGIYWKRGCVRVERRMLRRKAPLFQGL